jgi:hypothetical protein
MNETVAAPLLAFFARDYLIKAPPHPRERSWIEATDESRLCEFTIMWIGSGRHYR